ncbi:MAG: hypothetical protein SAJ12_00585 [Jaaginema sp. PMC 1079.18]|nr:hypothetical protein [Jaaginema sp. PMC 1080.18]MEC4849479.1 hypothetical protein [Jaaginema sp. PMC 1079.18]MEC4866017.1 hypothetical protein [Jaaginema sp. PMC 1078.18]
MDTKTLKEKGQQIVAEVSATLEKQGKQAFNRINKLTKTTASELTEEAVIAAVDRAVDAIEIAGKRIRERQIPTENTSLEVDISIGGILNLKIKADVPTAEQLLAEE